MSFLLILMLIAWFEQPTDHFVISYRPEDGRAVDSLVRIVEECYTEVTSKYGFSLEEKVRVYLLSDRTEANQFYGGEVPSWVIAFASPRRSTIYLLSPKVTKSFPDTREVFTHELAHVFNHHISPQFPLWLNEGLAMWMSKDMGVEENFWLSLAALTGSFLSLRDIEDSFPTERRRTGLAYAESRNSVIYIVHAYGIDGLRILLRELNSTGHVDEALRNSFGLSYDEFDLEFLSFLRGKYRWLSILGENFPLWSLLLVLFLVVYTVKRYKTRKKLELLRKEDHEMGSNLYT